MRVGGHWRAARETQQTSCQYRGRCRLFPDISEHGWWYIALTAGSILRYGNNARLALARAPISPSERSTMKPRLITRRLAMLTAVTALLITGAALAADVHVMISAGFFQAYSVLAPAFERASGHRLVTTRGPSLGDSPEAIPTRLTRGEAADVVILDGGAADELGKRGLVRADSKVELARSLIGMVVRAGAAKPDISSVE